MKIEEVYSITKQKNVSTHISERRLAHLGPLMGNNTPSETYCITSPIWYPGKVLQILQPTLSRLTGMIWAPVYSETGLRGPRQDVCDSTNRAAWSDLILLLTQTDVIYKRLNMQVICKLFSYFAFLIRFLLQHIDFKCYDFKKWYDSFQTFGLKFITSSNRYISQISQQILRRPLYIMSFPLRHRQV